MEIGAKLSKEQVNYRSSESCILCGNYNSSFGNCAIVKGNISPKAVCDKFAMREAGTVYRDKEYFEKEYARDNRKED
jgi:hypothetical protein